MTSSTSSTTAQATSPINTNLVYKSGIQEKLTAFGLNLNAYVKEAVPPIILGLGAFGAFAKASDIRCSEKVYNFFSKKFGFRLPLQFMRNAVLLTGMIAAVFTTYSTQQIYLKNVRSVFVNKKIKKIADQSITNSKSALVIRADFNTDNGALSTEQSLTPIKMLAKTHSIKCVNGYFDTFYSIQSDIKNSQKYDVILVQGHGGQRDVILQSVYGLRDLGHRDSYDPNKEPEKKLTSGLVQVLKENGKIILHSCSTGNGEHNIARALSSGAPSGAAVYASPWPMTGSRIDKNGNAKLSSIWIDTTGIYQNGELIYSSLPIRIYQNVKSIYSLLPTFWPKKK